MEKIGVRLTVCYLYDYHGVSSITPTLTCEMHLRLVSGPGVVDESLTVGATVTIMRYSLDA